MPCTSLPSDHACILSTCWPRQTWIATSRRGWVIAAWVLECRARFANSSVRTTCDSWVCHQEKLLEAHSISTTWLPLKSFLPPSGRNGKASQPGEICASAMRCKFPDRANRLLYSKIKFDGVITGQCDARNEVVCPQAPDGVKRRPQISADLARIRSTSTGCLTWTRVRSASPS